MCFRPVCCAVMVALVCLSAAVATAQEADPFKAIEEVKAKYPDGLPRYMTPEEQGLPIPHPTRDDYTLRAPPPGFVYCSTEYDPMQGMFIAWESYTTILTEMTKFITQNDVNAMVYVVVDSASEQTSAYNTLNAAGCVMSRVQFFVRTTDTVWIRDYGPRFIFEDQGSGFFRKIIDHVYNRPRPNDDALNDWLSTPGSGWNEPQYDIPLTHGGGNFHLFTNRDAFMTSLITAENPGLSEQDVKDLYAQYQNLDLTIYTGFPTSYDSTRHIDMWMSTVDDYKIIIGQYPPSSGQPYTITEGAVADLTARGYTVYRTPGSNSGGTHYTYTNSVIFNDQVFISRFAGSFATQDAQALGVYQAAFPGKTIRQILNSDIITAAGAMHCIMMHVPSYPADLGTESPRVKVITPNLGGPTWYVGQPYDITWDAWDRYGAVIDVDLYYSTDGGASYPNVIAIGETNDGVYSWTVPNSPTTQARIKVVAHDADANTGEDGSDADFSIAPSPPVPTKVYEFLLNSDPGWSIEGSWAFGQPTGGGSHNHDPSSGHTGTNVFGYNLTGDYTNNMPVRYLTTTAIDCSFMTDVQLRFWRWLGVEGSAFDHTTVEVSNNGAVWTTVWQNGSTALNDSAWSQQVFDISGIADSQATVYIRWGMGPTDVSTTYPGWNVDDVELWGIATCSVAGDMDRDGGVGGEDIDEFVGCYLDGTGDCSCADMDGLNGIGATDLPLFIDALLQ